MKTLFLYLLQVIAVSGILYSYYHFFLRNKKFHRYNRFYLLAALLLSITVPFLNITVYFTGPVPDVTSVTEPVRLISTGGFEENIIQATPVTQSAKPIDWSVIAIGFYLLICLLALIRIVVSFARIRRIIRNNRVEQVDNIRFINTDEPGTPFSFFRWLFWNRKIELSSEKGEQIFRHELFHIEQKHSRDLVATEFVTMFFWINPFFHLIKKELKAIHEFLADQFAVTENKKWEYAELLLMQALQTKHHLVNPFFHNQVKRRIAMITNSQKPSYQYLRKLMVLPVTAILVALFAFTYKNKTEAVNKKPAKTFTVIIDAGHGGKDGGAIASDGTQEKDITLAIAKRVKELNEDKNIQIILTRDSDELPDLKERSAFSNNQNASLLLSLHINSSLDKTKTGFEIYIPKSSHSYYSENKILGAIALNYCAQFYGVTKTIKQSNKGIWMLDNSNCPSALIECGYITNQKDLAFIKVAANQDKIAESILMTIDQFIMQKNTADWEERKASVTDTIKPVIIFKKDATTGKTKGTYNGRNIKEVNEYGKAQQLIFIFDNGDLVMLSEDLSNELREKYKTELNSIVIDKIETTKSVTDNKIFDKVEIEPAFPGGVNAWREYLTKTIDPLVPVNKGAPEGNYTAVIQFVVDKEGKISDFKPLTKHGYGMEQEAVRVIKNGPDWLPAIQNGHKVTAYRKQTVNFQITDDKTGDALSVQSKEPGVLYVGIENPVTVSHSDVKTFDLHVTLSNGSISGTDGKYVVKVTSVGTATLDVFTIENGIKQALGSMEFKTKLVPRPFSGTEAVSKYPDITLNELKNIDVYKLLNIDPAITIVSFQFTIDLPTGDIAQTSNTGAQFTDQTKKLIRDAIPGKMITVDNIKVMFEGKERKVPSRFFYVKN